MNGHNIWSCDENLNIKKNFMAPFLRMGFKYLKAIATSRRTHPVGLNARSRGWKSGALTTRPLLHNYRESENLRLEICFFKNCKQNK